MGNNNRKLKQTIFTLTVLALSIFVFSNVKAEVINIGMSTALTGPAKDLGNNVKAGVESYFNEVNLTGGINGKQLKLIALDDGYEPNQAASNARTLINQHKVLAMIANVGTPTAVVTVPIANELKTPLIAAVTGAGILRLTPPERYIINYRASYAQETAAMIEALLNKGIAPEEIAFFTQKDGYGDAGYNGAINALKKHGYTNFNNNAHGRYQRNTVNVEEALVTILDAKVEPKAIIMVGAYKPCARFIQLAKEDLPDTIFLNVSFVGSMALLKELGDQADDVIITQVVPHYQSNLPVVAEYRKALKQFNTDLPLSFLSLEGYLAAKILVAGMKNIPDEITAESIVDGIEQLGIFNLGLGNKNKLDKNNHQASNQVWPTRVNNGRIENFNWSEL